MKRADGKFIEIGRENASSDALQFAPDETTPSLLDGEVFVTGENTKATAIINFTDAETGVVYTIYGSGSEYASTIAAGGNFVLTEAMTLSEGKFINWQKPPTVNLRSGKRLIFNGRGTLSLPFYNLINH